MLSTSADDSIALHYQPLADSRGRVVSFEALMRWHHQKRGPISPEAFIPVFENCGLILPLSRWALKQACLDAASWKRPMQVSVNLSPVQFQEDDVPELVATVLAETGLPAERLELEITEAWITIDHERTGLALRKLARQGVQIALDDASGAVGLPVLVKDYPISKIKIARNLVQNVETSPSARSLIHMIVLVAKSQRVPVAAKGIETANQLAFILKEGCEFFQGFFVNRPAPMASFAGMTGNVAEDFRPGSTGLPAGTGLTVPFVNDPQPVDHFR